MKRFDLAIVIAATALIAGGAGFALGHASAAKTASASTQNGGLGGSSQNGSGGRYGMGGARSGQRPVFGTVASVSGNTVTVTDRSGNPRTVTLSSSTTYTSGDGSSVNQASITQGVTIAAFGATDSGGNVTATRVTINPSFGGGNGGGGMMGGQAPQGGSSLN